MKKNFKLAIITTAFFPENDWRRQLRLFLASAQKHDIPVLPYGIGEPYCMWAEMKIQKKLPVFESLMRDGYTHVLYTDARDALFLAPVAEMVDKYQRYGMPQCLASTEKCCNPDPLMASNYPDTGTEYKYHCVGGYIGELPYMHQIFTRMKGYMDRSGDDAAIWQWGWAEGWFRPLLDKYCEIFQVTDHAEDELRVENGRVCNRATGAWPCIIHMNGGFSSPGTGKDHIMIPWARRLGIVE